MRDAIPTFLRGVVAFRGRALDTPQPPGTCAANASHGVEGRLVPDVGSMEI